MATVPRPYRRQRIQVLSGFNGRRWDTLDFVPRNPDFLSVLLV